MTILGKSYGKWNKVEKLIVVPISYEGSDEEEYKMVLGNN